MDINGILYFAPSIPFKGVDWDGDRLPKQFRQRIDGFYLTPAECCIAAGHAFAAGLLLASCIDALARLKYQMLDGKAVVSRRIKKFLVEELISFKAESIAGHVCDQFRNGLVHEARLKGGARFSLDIAETVHEENGLIIINPAQLLIEVRKALNTYIEHLEANKTARTNLANDLKSDLNDDIQAARRS